MGVKERKRVRRIYKKEIARKVQELNGRTFKECMEVVQATFKAMAEMVDAADPEVRIEMRGFGALEVVKFGGYWQPNQFDRYWMPVRRRIRFRPSWRLRAELNRPCADEPWLNPTPMPRAGAYAQRPDQPRDEKGRMASKGAKK